MRLRGRPQWREEDRRTVAKLYALHVACHPNRIAARWGCTPKQVRALGCEYGERELPGAVEALETLGRHSRPAE